MYSGELLYTMSIPSLLSTLPSTPPSAAFPSDLRDVPLGELVDLRRHVGSRHFDSAVLPRCGEGRGGGRGAERKKLQPKRANKHKCVICVSDYSLSP